MVHDAKKIAEQIEINRNIAMKLSPIAKYTKLINNIDKKKQTPMKRKFSIMYSSLDIDKKDSKSKKLFLEKDDKRNIIVPNAFQRPQNDANCVAKYPVETDNNFIQPFKVPYTLTSL
uniref:Uncharacterized protein n=1 Tax=Parastrongyloides trichosuri TaxID=131310 RepID=A0A0N4ZPY0_PARTI